MGVTEAIVAVSSMVQAACQLELARLNAMDSVVRATYVMGQVQPILDLQRFVQTAVTDLIRKLA